MASKPSKPQTFTFTFILFLFALLIFSINYLKQVRNVTIYPKLVRKPTWLNVISRELRGENINIGFVNMDGTKNFDKIHANANITNVCFDRVQAGIEWSDLFPTWIDEDSPKPCPEIPMPRFDEYEDLDVVVAKVPCNGSEESGLRDVFRLQVNLVVANMLVRSKRRKNGINRPIFAVFIGSCKPMWEIFRCDDLLWHGGNSWVYKPDLRRIKQKVLMPVGTCQLAPPFAQSDGHWKIKVKDPRRHQK